MVDVRVLLKFLGQESVSKNLFMLLMVALLPIVDLWILISISASIPNYHNIVLAVIVAVGLLGFLAIFLIIRSELTEIKALIKDGVFPERNFNKLAGSFLTAVLMVSPGILTTTIALLLLIPSIRTVLGKRLILPLKNDIKELYEYIKLYEIEMD